MDRTARIPDRATTRGAERGSDYTKRPTRPCRACGTRVPKGTLRARYGYRCAACAPRTRDGTRALGPDGRRGKPRPPADWLWEHRHTSIMEKARLWGVHHATMQVWVLEAGFKRTSGGKLVSAPCGTCGQLYAPDEDVRRLCRACRGGGPVRTPAPAEIDPAVRLFREELARWRRRQKAEAA